MEQKITKIYSYYQDIVRPLISEIEGRLEYFAAPVLELVPSMFHEIAIYTNLVLDNKAKEAEKHLDLAWKHLFELEYDCYKYLNFALKEKVEKYKKACESSVDLAVLDDGKFYEYEEQAKNAIKEAISLEEQNLLDVSLEKYKNAVDNYRGVEKIIDNNITIIKTSKINRNSIIWGIIGWIASIVISVVVGVYETEILSWMQHILTK